VGGEIMPKQMDVQPGNGGPLRQAGKNQLDGVSVICEPS